MMTELEQMKAAIEAILHELPDARLMEVSTVQDILLDLIRTTEAVLCE